MHSVMRSDFLNRFLSLDRFQRDSRLHVCAETPPLPRFHSAPFRGSRFYTLFTGPNFGEQLKLHASQVKADPAATQAPEAFLREGLGLIQELAQQKLGISLIRKHDDVPKLLARTHRFRA